MLSVDELDAALDHATRGVALCGQLPYAWALAAGLATLAWIRQAQGDPGGARETMREAEGDDHTGTLEALTEALALAWPEGYVRVFVDEGAPMAALLGSLMTASGTRGVPGGGVPPDYLRRLADAVHQELAPTMRPVRRGGAPMPGLVEPLSDRELEVLGLLAAGKPNQAIAEELVVALDTV